MANYILSKTIAVIETVIFLIIAIGVYLLHYEVDWTTIGLMTTFSIFSIFTLIALGAIESAEQ